MASLPSVALDCISRELRVVQVCKVTYLGSVAEGRTQVGIEFREPAPEFWHIQFP
jgi:hypothetical protein